MNEYTIMRINDYDIIYDDYINDVYSVFYIGIEYKKTGKNVVIEIISKTNLTMNIINIKNIIRKCDKIDVIFKMLDVFECEQNLYIVWEDFMNNMSINREIIIDNDKTIERIFRLLQKIFIFVVDNGLLIDAIKYEDIIININYDKIMIRPQKKRKAIVYGSPIYSPHYRYNFKNSIRVNGETNKVNGEINVIEENLIVNISILMYELIIKRINREFIYDFTEIVNSDSVFSEFLISVLDPNINMKVKSDIIRNILEIKNKSKNKN